MRFILLTDKILILCSMQQRKYCSFLYKLTTCNWGYWQNSYEPGVHELIDSHNVSALNVVRVMWSPKPTFHYDRSFRFSLIWTDNQSNMKIHSNNQIVHPKLCRASEIHIYILLFMFQDTRIVFTNKNLTVSPPPPPPLGVFLYFSYDHLYVSRPQEFSLKYFNSQNLWKVLCLLCF